MHVLLLNFSPGVLIFCFVLLVIAAIVLAQIAAHRRRQAMAKLAAELGLDFQGDVGSSVVDRYESLGFDPFGQGSSRTALNLIYGRRNGIYWEVFDYRYTTGSGKNRSTHRRGIVAAQVALDFPRLRVRAEGWFDRVKGFLGFDDIDFESEQFNRRYHVGSDDRQRAYEILHPQMLEFLLSQPDRDWQVRGGHVVLTHAAPLEPPQVHDAMAAIEAFLGKLPNFVREDLSRRQ